MSLLAGLTLIPGTLLGTAAAAGESPAAKPALPPQILHELQGVDGIAADDVWAVGTACHGSCKTYFTNETWIQHFDGTTWTHVRSFTDPRQAENLTDVVEIASDDVWVVGQKVDIGGGTIHDVAQHWDGSSWTSTPTRGNGISGIDAVSSDDVWAVGNLRIHHWDGTAWHNSPFEAPPSSEFSSFSDVLALSRSNVWAVGTYEDTSFVYHPLAEHWDGARWSYVDSPAPKGGDSGFSSVSGTAAGDIWAVGSQKYNTATLAEHWDGTSWRQVTMSTDGLQNPELTGVAAVAKDDVWAIGINEPSGSLTALFEHWDGSAWSSVSPPAADGGVELYGALALSGSDIWAVGTIHDHKPHALHEHWDGSSWSLG